MPDNALLIVITIACIGYGLYSGYQQYANPEKEAEKLNTYLENKGKPKLTGEAFKKEIAIKRSKGKMLLIIEFGVIAIFLFVFCYPLIKQ